jgi:hypothetical protein
LTVFEAAPALLTMLCHLVVDEDSSWSDFTIAMGDDLVSLYAIQYCVGLISDGKSEFIPEP